MCFILFMLLISPWRGESRRSRRGNNYCDINYSEDRCYKCDRGRLNIRGGGRLQKFESQRGFGKKLSDNWWRDSIIPSSASDEVRPRIDRNREERLRRKHRDWKIEVGATSSDDPSAPTHSPTASHTTTTPLTRTTPSRPNPTSSRNVSRKLLLVSSVIFSLQTVLSSHPALYCNKYILTLLYIM